MMKWCRRVLTRLLTESVGFGQYQMIRRSFLLERFARCAGLVQVDLSLPIPSNRDNKEVMINVVS